MFKSGTQIESKESSSRGRRVVAVIGFIGDWSAYEQAYSEQTTIDMIARQGDIISENEARKLFPELKNYKWRN